MTETSDMPAATGEGATAQDVESTRSETAWSVVLHLGPAPVSFDGAHLVDVTPRTSDPDDVIDAVASTGLTPSDLRSRALFVTTGAASDVAVAVYAALCGFAGRRLEARVEETALDLPEFDRLLRSVADAGRPAEIGEQAQVGGPLRADMAHVDVTGGFTPQALSVIRFSRRLRFVPPTDPALALTQFVAVAAVRGRAGTDRFPLLCTGEEVAELEVDATGTLTGPGICLLSVRRRAEELRRTLRGDTRDAVADYVEPSPRQKRLLQAADLKLTDVLQRLGSVSASIEVPERDENRELTGAVVSVEAWRCPVPGNHTNGDASPSARIRELPLDVSVGPTSREVFRCFRCLPEWVDALRLAMWARELSADEAADWLLGG